MKVSELRKLLKLHGCYELEPGKEHDTWFSPITNKKIRVPRHQSKEIATGTLNAILKQAGIK